MVPQNGKVPTDGVPLMVKIYMDAQVNGESSEKEDNYSHTGNSWN